MRKIAYSITAVLVLSLLTGFRFGDRECRLNIPENADLSFETVSVFNIPEANQGVGVDRRYFYAVNNRSITKHDKRTGKEVASWYGESDGPIIHLDSAAVYDGKIYCAHSNYSTWPMTSSIEIWDAKTMRHIGSHSFGILYGSCTWVDWHKGYWWATFANYDKLKPGPDGTKVPYGYKKRTTMVKFTKSWIPVEAWIFPDEILDRLSDMSNSGGSWGPDGYLYLTGHDNSEVYRCKLPESGSIIELLDIIPIENRGQGIAWDKYDCGVLYCIIRATDNEEDQGITNKVTVNKLSY